MTAKQALLGIIGKGNGLQPTTQQPELNSPTSSTLESTGPIPPTRCPSCGAFLIASTSRDEDVIHNPQTCRLVNLALGEMRVRLKQQIRVEIYRSNGPLRGFYSTAEPFSIHVSEEAYVQFLEYIIFHETKHLVDCLTKGWSEEGTPDTFARYLCAKYGYGCPPPHQHIGITAPSGVWNEMQAAYWGAR